MDKKYIERDPLLKKIKAEAINQMEFYADRHHPVVQAYSDIYGMIERAEANDVRENVRATMELVDTQPYFKKHYRRLCCSNCKREVLKSWSFCPDCGAQFVKEKMYV